MPNLVKRLWPSARAPVLIILCVFIAYPEIIAGRNWIMWDSYDYLYPKFLYLVDSLRSGYFPLWNPFEMSGVPLWPWNGSLLNPVNLGFALLSLIFDPVYIFQLMLLFPVALGGAGAYALFKSLRCAEPVSVFGGVAFSFVMFGPILGQYTVAYSIAFMPWVFYITTGILDQKGETGSLKICLYSLAFATFLVTAYPVMVFLVCAAAVIFGAFRFYADHGAAEPGRGQRVLRTAFVVLGLACAVSSVVIFPILQNRSVVSAQLRGDFVSPDPRLRVSMAKGAWTQGYERTKANYLALAKENVLWHGSFTLVMFFLLVAAAFRFFKDKYVPFFSFLALLFVSYAEGRGGAMYEFVFNYVPLFWNNRYPIFGLSLVKFLLMLVSIGQLDYIYKLADARDGTGVARAKRHFLILAGLSLLIIPLAVTKPFYWPFFASIPGLSLLVYFYLRRNVGAPVLLGVLAVGLIGNYYAVTNPFGTPVNPEEAKLSRERKINVEYSSNSRALTKSKDYVYYDRSWIFSKTPINQGYYMADSPAYWYLKNSDFLGNLFYLTGKIKEQARDVARSNYRNDNDFTDALVSQVLVSSGMVTIVDRMPAGSLLDTGARSPGEISGVKVTPGEFFASVHAKFPALLVLTDKYYPGWEVYVDGLRRPLIRTNICFKGVYLEPGKHEVRFVFKSNIFYAGLALSVFSLIAMGLACVFRSRRELEKGRV